MKRYQYFSATADRLLHFANAFAIDAYAEDYCNPEPEWLNEDDECTKADCRNCVTKWLNEEI